jgi:hypothetical protein
MPLLLNAGKSQAEAGTNSIGTVAFASTIVRNHRVVRLLSLRVIAAVAFNKLFFGRFDPLVRTLLAYTTFAIWRAGSRSLTELTASGPNLSSLRV